MLNVIVRAMAASLDFYQRLGIAIPGEAAGDHVQLKMPGGFSLELDTAESARLWHAGWRADPASARVVLGFMLASRVAVDDRYAELIATGYRARQPPFDAFWGARYAVVADPDSNDGRLVERRERWGLTYFTRWEEDNHVLAPVVERLAGTWPDNRAAIASAGLSPGSEAPP